MKTNTQKFSLASLASLALWGLLLPACGAPELVGDLFVDPFTGEEIEAAAAKADMNRLLNDNDISGGAGVTVAKVQAFLNKKGGPLKGYRDPAFGNQTAAQIIVEQSRASNINPVYMLARIQTESSLVSGGSTSNIPKATGCGCPDGGGCGAAYRGFGKQVQCAAQKFRGYLRDLDAGRPTVSGWKPGVAKNTLDPCRVVPQNKATAALYTYTPWVGAYAAQCGKKTVGGSSLVAAIYSTYNADPTLK
jgi:hypothetical protein